MPGGSPYFRSERAVEHLYTDLEILFARIAKSFRGQTLSEFHDSFVAAGRSCASAPRELLAAPLSTSTPI